MRDSKSTLGHQTKLRPTKWFREQVAGVAGKGSSGEEERSRKFGQSRAATGAEGSVVVGRKEES